MHDDDKLRKLAEHYDPNYTQNLIHQQIAQLQQLAHHLLLSGDYENLKNVLQTINAYQELTNPPDTDTITP